MKKIFGVAASAMILWACGNSGEEENNAPIPSGDTTTKSAPVEYKPVVAAAFMGVVPCADCDGIETRVTLFADTSYEFVNNYLGKNPTDTAGLNSTKKGKFMMHNDTLHLEGIPTRFIQNDTALIQLDPSGKKMQGKLADKYFLKKLK
ncbi:MAG: hypothetical protein EOO89_27475 [Pedobacter sp.]|nr:MAG: hypothetical protein EOO89_27475 [Pedobacter sp.]